MLGAAAGVCVGLARESFCGRSPAQLTGRVRSRTVAFPVVHVSAGRASDLRLDHPHVLRRCPRPRHGGGHRRRASAVRSRGLARGARQAQRNRRDAGVWRIRRQGGTGRADWRRPDEPVRRHPAPSRRGPASTGDLRHQRRIRGGVRYAGLRRALRHRSALSRTDRLHRHFSRARGRHRGASRLRSPASVSGASRRPSPTRAR